MKKITTIFALCISLWQATEPTKRSQADAVVTELRATKRLPAWANYVCYDDDRSHLFEEFSLIAYQPFDKLSQMEKDALKLGYIRSMTYQWYMVSDLADIQPMNLPPSPEEFATTASSLRAGSTMDAKQYTLLLEHELSEQNAIALAKAARKDANASDEQTLALLDGPNGTAYRTFLRSHPDFGPKRLYLQKYINMGIASVPEKLVVYAEGSLLFDVRNVGSFETPTGSSIRERMSLSDTDTGLRYVRTATVDGKSLGIPVAGVCDPL
jgi:hypothetical protein